MGIEKGMTMLEETIEKAGGCAIVDGGFATQLEKHGAHINDPLWSALCLINDPHLIKRVHWEYMEAGADILVSSSYQATIPGFQSRGMSMEEAESLLIRVDVTQLGVYGNDVGLAKLKDFHRRRLQVLAGAGPDLLAFETIPNTLETQAIVDLLEEENINIPSWICYSCIDGDRAPSGESFEECLNVINKSNKIAMVGINCAPPQFVDGLIRKFIKLTNKMIIVYPNSGEIWDGKAKRWLPSQCSDEHSFTSLALRWRDSGAKLIGGCCRTTPSTIQGISKAIKRRT